MKKTNGPILLSYLLVAGCINLMACSKMTFSPANLDNQLSSAPSGTSILPGSAANKTVSLSQVVANGNKQVDFLVVFDNSNSMLPDLKKLALSLSNFVTDLESSNIDWQMCMTTTGSQTLAGQQQWGSSYSWVGYLPNAGTSNTLLKRGTPDLDLIFTNTVNSLKIGATGSGDERGIKAVYQHFKNGKPLTAGGNGCYRKNAAASVIIVSNEDERSVGGDKTKVKSTDANGTFQPLEFEDIPINLTNLANFTFGEGLRFTFNSIIVKPGDSNCEMLQDKSGTSPSHIGNIYSQMSSLTGGGVGSICDSNFANNLNIFKDKIVNSLENITLPCAPAMNTLKVTIDEKAYSLYQIDRNNLKFNSPLLEGTKIDINFQCK